MKRRRGTGSGDDQRDEGKEGRASDSTSRTSVCLAEIDKQTN
jgi:hypothetical protein